MRPKDNAKEKLFYVLFSLNTAKPQPLAYWQCLASLTNLYSQVLFRCTTDSHDPQRAQQSPRKANTNAQFAIEIWLTVIIVVAYIHPLSIAIKKEYLGAPHNARHFIVITDASPWRLCAALYDPPSNELLIWTTYRRLPYARNIRAQFQVRQKYLGHLLDTILVAHYGHTSARNNSLSY
jgi:hypothetical protein